MFSVLTMTLQTPTQPTVKYRVDCILDPEWKSGIIDQLSQPLKEKQIKENIIIICIWNDLIFFVFKGGSGRYI